jgi:hypothetical protein
MTYTEAYVRLEHGAIDDIDAAVFSGDMFSDKDNREDFLRILKRWETELKNWEAIDNERNL